MYFWKDKQGNKLTIKQFFSKWKQGIENITPKQRLVSEVRGTLIMLVGYIFSFFAVIFMINKIGLLAYGLILIFFGMAFTTGLKWIALKQQLKVFDDIEKQMEVKENGFR